MRRQMYVSKEFYDVVSFLSDLSGKNKVDITKEIAEFVKEKMIEERYKFRLFG